MPKILTAIFFFLAAAFTLPASASAAQFESVIEGFAIPSDADHTVNMWKDTDKIKGIKWKWPYYETGAHDHKMWGKAKVGHSKKSGVGETNVEIQGSRMNIQMVFINVSLLNKDHSTKEINHLFGAGTVKKIELC